MRWLLILAVLVAGCSTDLGPNQAEIRAQREAESKAEKIITSSAEIRTRSIRS